MSSTGSSIVKQLEFLDFHPKLVRDFAVRTKSGAVVSLSAVILSLILFLSEWMDYRQSNHIETMEVDTARGESMRINFDVTFPSLPCAVLSLDAMDASGQHQMDVLHDIFKQRLAPDGTPFGESEKGERNTLKAGNDIVSAKRKAIAEGRGNFPPSTEGCGSCYGAGAPNECCNTCESVREAYRRKGWQMDIQTVEQCKKEGYAGDLQKQVQSKEGCNIYGHLQAPKVAGSFHLAPSHTLLHARVGEQDVFPLEAFNVSHRINSLTFGPYVADQKGTLDGHVLSIPTGTGMHQYFIKLVPTLVEPLSGQITSTYQFSVTEHLKPLDHTNIKTETVSGVIPGIHFNFDLSPLRVHITEKRKSFLHFLTRVCSIIGGVFIVMGVVDRLIYKAAETTKWGGKKMTLD